MRVKVTDIYGASVAHAQIVVHRAPDAAFSAAPSPAVVGERSCSTAPPRTTTTPIANYTWDLDGDGTFETNSGANPKASRTFTAPGTDHDPPAGHRQPRGAGRGRRAS